MTSPIVAFYGDDLTGSTDTLSVLAGAGLAALLFLDVPTAAEWEAAGPLDAFGIAGTARAMSPVQMDRHLPAVFDALAASGARLVHYKTCSTFDSSAAIGSIGHALSLARSRFHHDLVPVVVGQPGIGRFCVCGTLFATATAGGPVHRLDRHPTMARHPVTPMHEADLRLVLAQQGVSHVALVDLRSLGSANAARTALAAALREAPEAVLFDVADENSLRAIGGVLAAALAAGGQMFAIGSSGLQQALLAGWDELAARGSSRGPAGPAPRTEPVLILSGSRSPVTAAQIETAGRAGFALVALDPEHLATPGLVAADLMQPVTAAARQLAAGRSVVAHTSLGPEDPRSLADASQEARERLAHATGLLAREVLAQVPACRLGIAGGDTSGIAARALGVRALQFDFQLAPGVPVCRVRASGAGLDGLQIMLKGGQMGPPDMFLRFAAGGPS